MPETAARKIIHVDMDAFYASVEERDNPNLVGLPVAVGYDGKRGVVATANYEARKFGVHSAMATSVAKRLCPNLIFAAPRFDVYRTVSKQVHTVFASFTDLIEPVSLDEAYLDVTVNKKNMSSAWTVAQNIRDKIYDATGLTASAGVSYNKFLAKLASDMRKPNGQFLITPDQGADFIARLPIAKFHGIGPATTDKMSKLGIQTGTDLKAWSLEALKSQFGKVGLWYFEISRGQDVRPVEPHRERKSVSAETTFSEDIRNIDHLKQLLAELTNEVWTWVDKNQRYGRTVTVKIKWTNFEQSTRSKTAQTQILNVSELRGMAFELLESVFPIAQGMRLIGVGISGFRAPKPKSLTQLQLNLD